MNDNLILLQAKLDEAKSKKNINEDINKIQKQIDKLKLQPEVDPKTISNLAKQLEGILNQKINISNISVDSKTGQQLSTTIAQDIVDDINKANGNLTTKLKETASKTVSSVGKSVVSSIISKGIEFVFNGIDNLIHKTEKAKEEIAQLQSESNHSESNIEIMNSELQTTKEKIEELEKKGKLSFTENAELKKLKEHNYELERNISLEEKKKKAANIKAVASISDNQKGLEKDFNKSLKKYKKKQNKIENLEGEIQKRSQNNAYDEEDIALVEKKLTKEKENLDVYKSKVSEGIADHEVNKQTILNKYNGDYSAITGNDKQLYDSITQQLNDAYELIYSDEEYNKLIIEPIFDTEGLEDTKGKLFSYFTGGGKLDETALRQALGDSIVNSLQQACELAGIEFPDMLQRISDSTNNTLDAFAPKISNPNSQYDVEQNLNSDAKRKYFQTLDEETQALLINTEIPETVKQSTLEEFKDFIATLQENGNATAIVNKQSIENAWTSLANTDDEEQKSTQSDLLELAKKGQLTEATFHNTTGADTFLDSINKSLPETIDWINSLVTSSEQLSYLQSNISSIQNAFSDFQENGCASAETLAGMSDELKQLRGWDSFAETLGDSSSSAEECRQAMNDLITEYINSNNFLSQLNDSNKDYYISTLSNMDVENAEEVVMTTLETKIAALAAEKKWCAEKGRELSTATEGEIAKFIKEQGYSQQTGIALYQLALKKELVNGTTLDFSGDISKIIEYVEYINGTARSLRTLNDIKNGKYSVPDSDLKAIKKSSQEEVDDAANKDTGVKIKIDPPSSKKSSGSGSNGSKSFKDSKQTIDWISRKLEVLQKNIDATKAKFDNLFSVKKKESNLNTQIKQTTALLNASKKAAIAYKNQADKIKLSKDKKVDKNLKKKVRNGKYNINDYSSNTAEKINKYKDYYDKYKEEEKQVAELRTSKRELKEQKYQLHVDNANAKIDKSKAWMELDSGNYKEQNKHLNAQKDYITESYKYQIKIANLNKDSIKVSQLKAEKEKELRDIEKQKFDNIANQYENELSVTQAKQDAISREIDLIQARGDMLDQSKYQSQIAIESQKIASLEQEKQLLEQQLKLKKLVEGTDEWYKAKEVIAGINEEIDKSKQSISEMTKSINEIGETLRTKVLDSFERIKTESDWLVGIMGNVEDFDNQTHAVTNEGIARLGSYISGSNISKQQADFVQQWLDELTANQDSNGEAHFKSALTGTDINYTADEYAEARKNAYDQIRERYTQYTDYKNKAIEWEISKLKEELSIMQEIIDAKKDALQSEKDLHNYQKSIQQSTKNIGLLQKQIAAVQGDTSEEGIARIQKLQKELTDAQDDLNETEYDRYLSDQEELLDKLYQEYEELINSESKQREVLFNRAIQDADNNTNTVVKTNNEYADALGYKFETNLQNLYTQNGSISNNVASILSTLQNGIIVTNMQGSQPTNTTQETPPTSPTTSNTEQLPGIVKELVNVSFGDSIVAGLNMTRREVENYIEKKGKEPVKGHSYKAVNATLANKYKKVLSDADLKDLAKKLGIEYDNSSKSGNLYNALKALQLSGFKKGGIATDLNKIALDNGDDGWVTVQRGEGILTPVQTETFTKDFIPRMDFMMDSTKILDGLVKNATFERQQNPTNIDAHYEFNLENCTNASDIIRQIQTDSNIRKALQNVTINQIHKSGKSLGVNRFI